MILSTDSKKSNLHESSLIDEPYLLLLSDLIKNAWQHSASDIHIEPYADHTRIRYRQDGILYEKERISSEIGMRLIVCLKVMSQLDIAERRLPQDGHFKFHELDIRLNTCPTIFGEKLVLRLLDRSKMILKMDELGLIPHQKACILENLARPQGMILVTGPTGSGKTITLYTMLQQLNTGHKNILTLEDPVEIHLEGINQLSIHPKIGLDFSTGLRSFLRQDPDVMMIGEIRDAETARIAIQAAQTGHLVLSTLHTNSSVESIARLQSLGISIHDMSEAISLIISQRLIRKLCVFCKSAEIISTYEFFQPVGCAQCLSGYYGRTGIYELLSFKKDPMVHKKNPDSLFQRSDHRITLRQAGLVKCLRGITTISELNRIIPR